jgi:hypothetical protein
MIITPDQVFRYHCLIRKLYLQENMRNYVLTLVVMAGCVMGVYTGIPVAIKQMEASDQVGLYQLSQSVTPWLTKLHNQIEPRQTVSCQYRSRPLTVCVAKSGDTTGSKK